MRKMIIEFQNGKIVPALLTEGEYKKIRWSPPWKKVSIPDIDPSVIDKLKFTEFKSLKFWDRVRLLFWRDRDDPEQVD